jgi:hypothetical protein
MRRIAVSELHKDSQVMLKSGTFTVTAEPINTGNSSIVKLDGLGIRDWANAKTVKVA